MNYTYYNKIINVITKNKEELNNFLNIELKERNNLSEWGLTESQKEYFNVLEELKSINNSFFRKRKIKKILNTIENNFNKKIRVLFIVNEYSVFPSVKSVYDTMKKDDCFICDLVYVSFNHVNKKNNSELEIKSYNKNGYPEVINYKNYDLSKSSPDIVIYLKPYDNIPKKFYIDEIEKVCRYIIYIPYGLHMVADKEIYRYAYQLPIEDKAWINVSQSKRNQELAEKYSKQKGKNFLLIGHPRMDLINEDYSNNKFYKEIRKIAGNRKIYLYDPHHAVADSYKWGTFKLFGLKILEYFSKNKNLFMLYRPHPFMEEALKKEYKEDDIFLEKYKKLLESENIIYDNSEDYLVAMHISDILISDANSFVGEFTMYNKPVIYTKYPRYKKIDDKEIEQMIYTVTNFNDIIKYINRLNEEKDDLRDTRSKKIKKYFLYDKNQTVAQKLIKYIKNEFYNR